MDEGESLSMFRGWRIGKGVTPTDVDVQCELLRFYSDETEEPPTKRSNVALEAHDQDLVEPTVPFDAPLPVPVSADSSRADVLDISQYGCGPRGVPGVCSVHAPSQDETAPRRPGWMFPSAGSALPQLRVVGRGVTPGRSLRRSLPRLLAIRRWSSGR